MQDQKISVTKRSTNIIKEYRNYMWLTDKNGKIINEPDHLYSHSMDAIRYGVVSLRGNSQLEAKVFYPKHETITPVKMAKTHYSIR